MPAKPYGYADVTAVTDECPFTEETGGKEFPQLRTDRPPRGGSIILGEPGFLALVRDAYRAGHLTESEWLARVGMHGVCLHGEALDAEIGVASPAEIAAMLGARRAAAQ